MTSATKLKPKAVIKPVTITLEFEAIGTAWNIELQAPASRADLLAKKVADRISSFDKNYSRFRPDSWVTKVGTNPGAHKVPDDFAPMFRLYQKMHQLTDGAVTPLIGDAMERAGYNAQYSLVPSKLQSIPKLEDVLEFSNNTLHVKYGCVLDFGASGKGYLVDLVAELLETEGVTSYLIDAGGDMRVASPAPHKSAPVTTVALEDPNDPKKAIGQVNLGGAQQRSCLCGSAGNRRKWANFHHIIDPRTLRPADEVTATWVVAGSTMLADGLATCLFFVDPIVLSNTYDFEYLRIMADNTLQVSPDFTGQIF